MLAAPRRWAVAEEIFVFPCCGLLVGSVHGAQQEAKRKEGPACLPACLVNNEETSTEASSRAFRKILLLEGKTSSVLLSPFCLQGDSGDCGVGPRPWYNLSCSSGKATIQINTGTYYVTSINYTDESFWVMDANLRDTNSSCPLPRSDQLPVLNWSMWDRLTDSYGFLDLVTADDSNWACFVNCSRAMTYIEWYKPITCLTVNNSFAYISHPYGLCGVGELQPSCRYMAMIPFDGRHIGLSQLHNASYTDIIGLIRKGFRVQFPIDYRGGVVSTRRCLHNSMR
ncbi:hypothetical protein ABZP36_016695 [Zizania latifolia]